MRQFIYILTVLLFLTSCGGNQTESEKNEDYEGTKKMVADILKTDDGKKAITEVLASDDMQQTYVLESKMVKDAINETLSNDKGKEFWTKMFEDPAFVKSFATALQDSQQEVIKNLMADSEYQKKLMEVLSNPEMEQQTLTLLTSQQFRSHLETVIEETFNSPMMQEKLSELILNAAKEMKPQNEGQSGSSEGGSGEDSGDQQDQGSGGSESGGGGQQ